MALAAWIRQCDTPHGHSVCKINLNLIPLIVELFINTVVWEIALELPQILLPTLPLKSLMPIQISQHLPHLIFLIIFILMAADDSLSLIVHLILLMNQNWRSSPMTSQNGISFILTY